MITETPPNVGDTLVCVSNAILSGNDLAPNLEVGKEYELKEIIFDTKGNPHYDVGLKSNLNYIRSFETKEELPRGNEIHWCHPSRFTKK